MARNSRDGSCISRRLEVVREGAASQVCSDVVELAPRCRARSDTDDCIINLSIFALSGHALTHFSHTFSCSPPHHHISSFSLFFFFFLILVFREAFRLPNLLSQVDQLFLNGIPLVFEVALSFLLPFARTFCLRCTFLVISRFSC